MSKSKRKKDLKELYESGSELRCPKCNYVGSYIADLSLYFEVDFLGRVPLVASGTGKNLYLNDFKEVIKKKETIPAGLSEILSTNLKFGKTISLHCPKCNHIGDLADFRKKFKSES